MKFSQFLKSLKYLYRSSEITSETQKINREQYANNEKKRKIYIWGGGKNGALGNEKAISNKTSKTYIKCPMHLYFANKYKIDKVACGFGFTLFSSRSKLYGCGKNDFSQIGTFDIINIAAGENHSLILTNKGVLSQGNNQFGQCGRTFVEDEKYRNSPLIYKIPLHVFDSPVIDVACGANTSYFLTSKGSIFSCGDGQLGQTGNGMNKTINDIPKLILLDYICPTPSDINQLEKDKFVKISSKTNTVLALTKSGKVFGWGSGEHNQFANFLTNSNNLQTNLNHVLRPILLNLFPSTVPQNNIFVKDIACSDTMCAVLESISGSVWVWGFGPLGLGPETKFALQPILIPPKLFGPDGNNRIEKIFAGSHSFFAMTESGDLYSWGSNINGALGLGKNTSEVSNITRHVHKDVEDKPFNYCFPQQISLMTKNIIHISTGYDHAAIIAKI